VTIRRLAPPLRKALIVIGAAALAVAVWDVATGGFYYTIAGIRVSSREAYKPFRLGMLAIVAAIWLRDLHAAPGDTSWERLPKWTAWITVAIALVSLVVALRFGIFAAGGSDSYGYVSQASLWVSGRLVTPDPLASLEPLLDHAVAPLGYRLAPERGALIPTYPPGLPLAMAAALAIAGASAVYYVVPVMAALAIWLTYRVGARADRDVTGMVAAVLLAFSPIFMFQSLLPMSDVPVTAWWLLGWLLALSPTSLGAFGSGLAVSAAILTRPNLVPLAIVVTVLIALQAPRVRRLTLFAAASVPGCLIVAVLNRRFFGSPLSSGYGTFAQLYAWEHWQANVRNYGGWLLQLNSPFVLLTLLAPLAARVRYYALMLAFVAMLCLCYLWYIPFPTWPFLRFLLPALPFLLILSSAVVVRAVDRLPIAFRSAVAFTLCTLLPIQYVITSNQLTIFSAHRSEHRYVTIGRHLGRVLPPNAVVLSMIQSGSIRMYGDRLTVRWDMLEPGKLDAAVDAIESRGHVPYLLLEEWEDPMFRKLFGAASLYGRLDWPPAFEYRDIGRVRIYALGDRKRFYAGENVSPRLVPLRE
jgi:hypothetical protein